MSKCLPCSKVSGKEQDSVKYFKGVFNKTGKIFWAYRLSVKETFKFVENEYFSKILNEEIKPNFNNGAEYFRIDEFKG